MYNAVDVIVKYVTSYRHCTHSMQSRVYETVKRPSVCTIIRSQQRRVAGLLLSAEQPSCNGASARCSAAYAGSVMLTRLNIRTCFDCANTKTYCIVTRQYTTWQQRTHHETVLGKQTTQTDGDKV